MYAYELIFHLLFESCNSRMGFPFHLTINIGNKMTNEKWKMTYGK